MNTNYTEVKYLNTNNLSLHSELIRIYGDREENTDLQLDIKSNSIMVPLVASTRTSIITIVSGGRRLRAAMALGMESVPVICYQFPSEEAEKHFILSANRDRPKTRYQQLMEGKEWELLEKQAAAIRRQRGLNQRWKNKDEGIDNGEHEYYPVVLLNDYRLSSRDDNQSSRSPRTVDKVGERIGMSGKTYERAKPVIEKCEKLRHAGKELEAAAIEVYLESVGINPVAKLLKAPNCDEVLNLVGSGRARNIKEALIMANRLQLVSAVVEGAVFFFPDKMLRKSSYYHLGRVVRITNSTAIVMFRDSADDSLNEHQYKCDELLTLNKELDSYGHQQLRDRIKRLIENPNSCATSRHLLNLLLGAVVCTEDEYEWVQIIEWRIAGASTRKNKDINNSEVTTRTRTLEVVS